MKLLDLLCGAGGAAMGYHRAGFDEIVGVDFKPQKHYPFTFVQADALEYVAAHGREFDAIHASPPCQRYSNMTKRWGIGINHPNLIGPVRERLQEIGIPYVIENVKGAPLENPVMLCGSMFGRGASEYGLRRHRYFEASFTLWAPASCAHIRQALRIYGHAGGKSKRDG